MSVTGVAARQGHPVVQVDDDGSVWLVVVGRTRCDDRGAQIGYYHVFKRVRVEGTVKQLRVPPLVGDGGRDFFQQRRRARSRPGPHYEDVGQPCHQRVQVVHRAPGRDGTGEEAPTPPGSPSFAARAPGRAAGATPRTSSTSRLARRWTKASSAACRWTAASTDRTACAAAR